MQLMQAYKKAILNFTLLLQLFITVDANQFSTEMCAAISANKSCLCIRDPNDFLFIECPAIGLNMRPDYAVHLRFETVDIRCDEHSVNVYDYLPKLQVGVAKRVFIDGCNQLAKEASANLLTAWGIVDIQELTYDLVDFREKLQLEQFKGLGYLLRLEIKNCNVTQLPVGLFEPLTKLATLSLRDNNIEHLNVHTFEALKSLTTLDLSKNRIKHLPKGLFREQQLLEYLDLGENSIEYVDKETFAHLHELRSLTLYENALKTLPADTFSSLGKLKSLYLGENNLTALPSGLLATNKNLETFSFTLYNGFVLSTVPRDLLANLPKLESVTLGCGLEQIPPSIFYRSSAIRRIDLAYNNLTSISQTLVSYQRELKVLDLIANQLLQLPKSVWTKNGLDNLLLAGNNLSSDFVAGISLEARNFYEEEDGKSLMLVPEYKINLAYNDFTTFSSKHLEFFCKRANEVELTNNSISTITLEHIDFLRNVSDRRILTVDLNHNPIHCDCQLTQFVRFIRGEIPQAFKNKIVFKSDKLHCAEPAHLRGKVVHELLPTELLCPFTFHNSSGEHCPDRCECWKRTADRTLIVNCSKAHLSDVPILPALTDLQLDSIELHIARNNVTRLPDNKLPGFAAVSKLFAAHNAIHTLEAANVPPALTHLDLRYNRLQRLDASTLSALNDTYTLVSLNLSHNAWLCDCDSHDLLNFAKSQHQRIHDLNEWRCIANESELAVHQKFIDNSAVDFCPPGRALAITLGTFAAVCLLITTLAALYYKYEQELKVWMYARRLCLCCVSEDELDQGRIYDAFISYSHKDMQFLTEHLVPQLEHGPMRFRLCVDERDWLVGALIPECIASSVEASCRVIIVLSRNFIESVWARMEFRSAHKAALNEGRARVIVIIYGDIGDIEELDEELKVYLRINIYLKWGDPWFWEKLRYAMPHAPIAALAPNRENINLTVRQS